MATHSSILAWKIPWTKEPGRLQSVRVTEFFLFSVCHEACGILGPLPGLNPDPNNESTLSPNHWTAREFPRISFFLKAE